MLTLLSQHLSGIRPFGIIIEPRAFIRFLTAQEFPAHAFTASLELHHETESFALLRSKEWSAESRSRRPVGKVVADAIAFHTEGDALYLAHSFVPEFSRCKPDLSVSSSEQL
jgi:hypothetical protein